MSEILSSPATADDKHVCAWSVRMTIGHFLFFGFYADFAAFGHQGPLRTANVVKFKFPAETNPTLTIGHRHKALPPGPKATLFPQPNAAKVLHDIWPSSALREDQYKHPQRRGRTCPCPRRARLRTRCQLGTACCLRQPIDRASHKKGKNIRHRHFRFPMQ